MVVPIFIVWDEVKHSILSNGGNCNVVGQSVFARLVSIHPYYCLLTISMLVYGVVAGDTNDADEK